jgi:tetratricopeptide (TPR) repeat protein
LRAERLRLLAPGALAFALYLPSLDGAFLYDDIGNIAENRALGAGLADVLRREPARPLLSLSWALNHAVSGLAPWSYHLVNAAIHGVNTALAAWLLLWMARRAGRPASEDSAVLGACLFAVTPMAVETVAYVSSRSTALCSLFALASLRLAVVVLESGGRLRLAGSLLLFVLALLTKEEAVALPLLLLLLDAFFLPRARAGRRLAVLGCFFALAVLGLAARRLATGAWLPPPSLDRGVYLLTQAAASPGYLLRAAFPFDPAFFRGVEPAGWPPDAWTLGLAGLGVALLPAAWALRRRLPAAAFAVLWMAACLMPSSSLVPLREMVVDHRAYLGGVGIAHALSGALWGPGRQLFVVGLLALLAARSVQYQRVLADPVRAWEDAVERAPESAEARRGLGEAYAAVGDARAESALQRAVLQGSADARSWANLGVYYLSKQRRDEAEQALRRAAAAAPGDSRIRDNLGMLLEAEGRHDEALLEYEAAVRGRPAIAQPRIRLALLLAERGDRERASQLLDEAARLEIDAEDARAIEAARSRLR